MAKDKKKRGRDHNDKSPQKHNARTNEEETQRPEKKQKPIVDDSLPRGGAIQIYKPEGKSSHAEENLFKKPTSSTSENEVSKPTQKQKKQKKEEAKLKIPVPQFNKSMLAKGMTVMAVITDVRDTELHVCLPNMITGKVVINELSDGLTQTIEDCLEKGQGLPESAVLYKLFTAGQYVRCVLLNDTYPLQLSMNPRKFNEGIEADDILEGMLLAGYIKSIEDNGYIIDFGIESCTGFLPKKDAQKYLSGRPEEQQRFYEGQPIDCCVVSTGRAITVTVNRKAMQIPIDPASEDFNVRTLRCGMLVKGFIESVVTQGLFVELFDVLKSVLHRNDLDSPELDPPDEYDKGQTIVARILYTEGTTKQIGLSAKTHIIEYQSIVPEYNIGDKFYANVVHIDSAGLQLRDTEGRNAYAQSKLTEADPSSPEYFEMYAVGNKVACRVISVDYLRNSYQVTLKASDLNKRIFSYHDLSVGDIVEGEIGPRSQDANYLIVKIGDSVQGRVREAFISDAIIVQDKLKKKLLEKYPEGRKVKCRVLTVDPAQRKLDLVLKPSIVDSKEHIIKDFTVTPGMEVLGVIVKILEFGLLVEFFGGITGFIGRPNLDLDQNEELDEKFHPGQVLKCKVTKVDPEQQKLYLTARTKASTTEIGSILSGVVVKNDAEKRMISVHLSDGSYGDLPYVHLSDHLSLCNRLATLYEPGAKLTDILVLIAKKKGFILTLKRSLVEAARDKTIPKTKDQINEGMFVQGYVSRRESYGVVVSFLGDVLGIARESDQNDGPWESSFVVGQSVRALVMKKDKSGISLNLKTSIVTDKKANLMLLKSYIRDSQLLQATHGTKLSQFSVGTVVDAEVEKVADYGAVFSIQGTYKGLATTANLEGVNCKVGKSMKVRILNISYATGVLDVTAKPEVVNIKQSSTAQVGNDVEATILLVTEPLLVLLLPKYGAIGLCATRGYNSRYDPFKVFSAGQKVKTTVLATATEAHSMLLATPTPASYERAILEKSDKKPSKERSLLPFSTQIDAEVEGVIDSVDSDGVSVRMPDGSLGRISVLALSDSLDDLTFILERFSRDQVIKCRVLRTTADGVELYATTTSVNGKPTYIQEGDIVNGRVIQKTDTFMTLELERVPFKGIVAITDVHDIYSESPLQAFDVGQFVKCYVKEIRKTPYTTAHVSLRPSRVSSQQPNTEDPHYQADIDLQHIQVDDRVWGYVAYPLSEEDKALTVRLAHNLKAKVKLSDLDDVKLTTAQAMERFPAAKLVRGRVIEVSQKNVLLALKPSLVNKEMTIDNIVPSTLVPGVITKVIETGLLIRLTGTPFTGLCHFSDVTDDESVDWKTLYKRGSQVDVFVRRVTTAKGKDKPKIVLSLLPKFLNRFKLPSSEEQPDQQQTDDITWDDGVQPMVKDQMEETVQEEAQPIEAPKVSKTALKRTAPVPTEEEPKQQATTNGASAPQTKKKQKKEKPAVKDIPSETTQRSVSEAPLPAPAAKPQKIADLGIVAGFEWDDFNAGTKKTEDEMDVDEDKSEEQVTDKKKAKLAKKREKQQKQKEISQREAEIDQRPPETVSDFEKLLLSSPNSSYIWIKYMAFFISLTEVEKARSVAHRATRSIDAEQGKERLNVWVAWLNLENSFGTPETLAKVFQEAQMYNEPKVVFLKLAEIYERAGKHDQVEELFKTMLRKFKESKKVWKKYALYLVNNGHMNQFRNLMPEALKSLPKKKHLETISKFGQLEFKHGSPERGRTIFEGIISNYPKRVDQWSIYLDMELGVGDVDIIRRLFQRAVATKFSSKKMKFFFKRFLAFEKEHGDQESISEVKRLAQEYIDSVTQIK